MFMEELLQFLGPEIGQNPVVHDERGDVALAGNAFHMLECLVISQNINLRVFVSTLVEITLGGNAPRTGFFHIKNEFGRHVPTRDATWPRVNGSGNF